jgi:ADP-ribosylglycohydrolase
MFQGDVFSQRLVAFSKTKGFVGHESNTDTALKRIASGVEWDKAGTPAPSSGNGAAARAALLGVAGTAYKTGIDGDFVDMVEDSCLPTHLSDEARFGAVIVASVARALANEDGELLFERGMLARILLELSPRYRHLDMFSDYTRLLAILSGPEDGWEEAMARLAYDIQPDDSNWPGISPYVRPSVMWALTSFLLHPTEFDKMVARCLRPGGDVDTIAAIAGSLFGIFNGTCKLNTPLLQHITDRGDWKVSKYIKLAQDLFTKVAPHLKK